MAFRAFLAGFLPFLSASFSQRARAYRMGLVNKVVKHDHLLKETKNIIDKILVRAPIAVGFSKVLINSSMRQMLVDRDQLEEELYAKCFETRDQKEGMKAFIEKRKPVFVGE